jgi:hypothetical protein
MFIDEISTRTTAGETSLDLPHHHRHCRLQLEVESKIFKCLKVPIQQKLIWGMGRGIYGILGHKILTKVFFLLKDKDARQLGLNTSSD